jgi:hypothetical protein
LEVHDVVFVNRTTMDLKDKWRNMQRYPRPGLEAEAEAEDDNDGDARDGAGDGHRDENGDGDANGHERGAEGPGKANRHSKVLRTMDASMPHARKRRQGWTEEEEESIKAGVEQYGVGEWRGGGGGGD